LVHSKVLNPSEATVGTENEDEVIPIEKFNERRESKYYQMESSNDKTPLSIGTKRLPLNNDEIVIYDSNETRVIDHDSMRALELVDNCMNSTSYSHR
jgi:hypothetical protein